jgi:hypothetical protein
MGSAVNVSDEQIEAHTLRLRHVRASNPGRPSYRSGTRLMSREMPAPRTLCGAEATVGDWLPRDVKAANADELRDWGICEKCLEVWR